MLTTDEERELEQQADEASHSLLLLLFLGRRGLITNRTVEFDPRRGVYRIDGKVVSLTTIRVLLAQIEKIGAKRIALHTELLKAKKITVATWLLRMAITLRVSHLMMSALALGGLDKATADAATNQRITDELRYLNGFGADIKAGRLSDAKLSARAKSYTLAMPITYWTVDQNLKKSLQTVKRVTKVRNQPFPVDVLEIKKEYREARRYRRASESCAGCRAASGYWMPIDEMPPIGSLDCGGRCRCFIVYR